MRLRVIAGEDSGLVINLPQHGNVTLGRDASCLVRISDPSVSRRQCQLIVSSREVWLEDSGSKWGTRVNEQPVVARVRLKPGDRIQFGDTELELIAAPAPPQPPSPGATGAPAPNPTGSPPPPPPPARPPIPPVPGTASGQRGSVRKSVKTASPPAVPAPPPAEPADPQPRLDIADIAGLSGETFLRYQIGKREARTASGVVYRARDTENQRAIALKFYHPQVFADDSAKRRFLRAMRTMLPVDHPHLVKLYGAGQSRGLCFTASEFIEGESAKQLIHRIGIAGMLDWRKVWRIGVQMSRALEHAEQLGIVHRNIQPSHILVRAEDLTAKLGGLMLAKAIDGDGRSAVTQKGAIVGDLHYLAPEQVTTDAVIDSRADLYSLGATLYALLTGRPPLEGTPRQLLERIPYDAPEPIGKFHLSVPSAFAGIVQRLLAKRPDDRFESASHLTRDLESLGRFQGLSDV